MFVRGHLKQNVVRGPYFSDKLCLFLASGGENTNDKKKNPVIFGLIELYSFGKKSPVIALADFLPVVREVVEAGMSPGVGDRVAK